MKIRKSIILKSAHILLILCLAACSNDLDKFVESAGTIADGANPAVSEYLIQEIPLPKEISQNVMEFSGLAWYGDLLVLLPQYPSRNQSGPLGEIYAIHKNDLLDFIRDKDKTLDFMTFSFDDEIVRQRIDGFEGYEAIAFSGDKVLLTIEARQGSQMRGYFVSGIVDSDELLIRLDDSSVMELPLQGNFENASDEAILVFEGQILTIFEDNGVKVSSSPQVNVFSLEDQFLEHYSFPNIEYRVTDASSVSANGGFWVMNYFYPGDKHLSADEDSISSHYGLGETHKNNATVERILKLEIRGQEIVLADLAPVYLSLMDGISRNWEGIEYLQGEGFFIITDKFPKSILGFVRY